MGHRSSRSSREPRVRTQEAAGGLGPGVGVWLAGAGKEDHRQGRRAGTGPGHGWSGWSVPMSAHKTLFPSPRPTLIWGPRRRPLEVWRPDGSEESRSAAAQNGMGYVQSVEAPRAKNQVSPRTGNSASRPQCENPAGISTCPARFRLARSHHRISPFLGANHKWTQISVRACPRGHLSER